ncbi:hypothetical protein ACQ5SO_04135 [Rhodovulum sp. DZ06]|uniref:hypothetical protein n=1 Tax=Rhodovulum sp. DZ06 TaxID=3425126 RepID=UPI003D358255
MAEGLRRAEDRLTAGRAEYARLGDANARLEQAVQGISGRLSHLRRAERRIQTLSVNAAISCARAGPDGRALMVISNEMAELTTWVRDKSAAAATTLERTAAMAAALIGADASAAADQLEQACRSAADLLESLERHVGETGRRGADAAAGVATVVAALDGLGPAARPAHDAVAALADEAAARDLVPPRGGAADEAMGDWFAARRAELSMESERRAFDALLEGALAG